MIRPEDYSQLPDNRHEVSSGSILLPTDKVITMGGGTSRQFVHDQGGDDGTFVFLLGLREARGPLGAPIEFLEGLFLSEKGVGFHPTWGLEQLLREIDLGGWRVIPTKQVLESWTEKIERRVNKGDADP